MSRSLVSAALNSIVLFPLLTTPSVLPSCAIAGPAKASGTAAATNRIEMRFILSPLPRLPNSSASRCCPKVSKRRTAPGSVGFAGKFFKREGKTYTVPNFCLIFAGDPLGRRCSFLRVAEFRRSRRPARHNEGHGFVDCPIEHDEPGARYQFHITRSWIGSRRDIHGGDLLAAVGVIEDPRHQAHRLHPRRWELDQNHALRGGRPR